MLPLLVLGKSLVHFEWVAGLPQSSSTPGKCAYLSHRHPYMYAELHKGLQTCFLLAYIILLLSERATPACRICKINQSPTVKVSGVEIWHQHLLDVQQAVQLGEGFHECLDIIVVLLCFPFACPIQFCIAARLQLTTVAYIVMSGCSNSIFPRAFCT